MVLHAVSGEDRGASVLAVDGDRHGQRALRVLQPVAEGLRDFQVIRHQIELVARHVENGMPVEIHAARWPRSGGRTNADSLRVEKRPAIRVVPPSFCRNVRPLSAANTHPHTSPCLTTNDSAPAFFSETKSRNCSITPRPPDSRCRRSTASAPTRSTPRWRPRVR